MCNWGVQWQLLVCKKLIDSEMWRYVHNNVWRVGCNEWVNLWITGVSEHNCGPWQEGSATVELLKARATVMYVAGRNGEVRKVLNTCMREQDITVNECVSVWWWKDPVGGYDDTWILWELRSLGLFSILRKYWQSYALFDTVKCSGGGGWVHLYAELIAYLCDCGFIVTSQVRVFLHDIVLSNSRWKAILWSEEGHVCIYHSKA